MKIAKKYLLILVLILAGGAILVQPFVKKALLYKFFNSAEAIEIIGLMHPSCDLDEVEVVKISDGTVYLEATFTDNTLWNLFSDGGTFTCRYQIHVSRNGEFDQMTAVRCGNTSDDGGIVACGDAISFNKMISKGMNGEFLKKDHPAVAYLEKIKGKKLASFDGNEIVHALLYTAWMECGYFKKY